MHAAVFSPATERLTLPPEQDTEKTPESNKRCVRHDGLNEAASC
jgi:hypothetical protein